MEEKLLCPVKTVALKDPNRLTKTRMKDGAVCMCKCVSLHTQGSERVSLGQTGV